MGKKKHRGKAVDKILQESQEKNPTDVLGSWTGVPRSEQHTSEIHSLSSIA